MANAARFLFDLDFSAPPEPEIEEELEEIPPEPMITVAEHERILAEAVERARLAGEEAARQDRNQLASEQSLALQKTILEEVGMIYTEVGVLLERLERDASNLAFAFASRFAERLVAQEPKQEVQALLHQILAPLRKTPHITIRLNDEIAEEIRVAVDQQMAELGFEGTLSVLPDPAIMPGDCEVEWADGGIGRNMRTAIRQVEQMVEDHFAHVPPNEEEDEEADAQTTQDEATPETEDLEDDTTDASDTPPSDQIEAASEQPEEEIHKEANSSQDDLQQDAPDNPLASTMDQDAPLAEDTDASVADTDRLADPAQSIPATEMADTNADLTSDFSPEVASTPSEASDSDTAPETEEDMK